MRRLSDGGHSRRKNWRRRPKAGNGKVSAVMIYKEEE